jgi:serine/threonine protein kinase
MERVFYLLFYLLVASAVAMFVFGLVLARARRQAAKAAIDAQPLGRYTLEQKIGEGAMGAVYRARHALLRRPTAIKMLDVDKMNDAAIERFEREVQITCQLNHPSTIVIYDYGRTPEGVFYYAMEYLDGIDLQRLVDEYGPQPPGRVIHILRQVCGSLFEAHSQGLVHRDIKPANVMLNRRGGEPDVVKLLDFGLVKDVHGNGGDTREAGLAGTPLYMSPEAIQSPMAVDARSDLYSVGAVGYFLLTGQVVFDVRDLAELCRKHIEELPVPPSKRAGRSFSQALEHAVLACLDKSPAKRPQTARDLANLLARCPEASEWSADDADAWWSRHERGLSSQLGPDAQADQPTSHHPGYARTMLEGEGGAS